MRVESIKLRELQLPIWVFSRFYIVKSHMDHHYIKYYPLISDCIFNSSNELKWKKKSKLWIIAKSALNNIHKKILLFKATDSTFKIYLFILNFIIIIVILCHLLLFWWMIYDIFLWNPLLILNYSFHVWLYFKIDHDLYC